MYSVMHAFLQTDVQLKRMQIVAHNMNFIVIVVLADL